MAPVSSLNPNNNTVLFNPTLDSFKTTTILFDLTTNIKANTTPGTDQVLYNELFNKTTPITKKNLRMVQRV